ncbi:MAG: nuclear transport factor 2 family protein [Proteobacteria bacterium]|nr:MAG: nuclear transport factor 2 family protein [Pseudomonadota bacterium]
MKRILLFFALTLSSTMFAQDVEIRKTIERFFNGLHTSDTLKIKSTFAKEMVLHSIAEKRDGGTLSVESVPEFLKSVASLPKGVKIEERLFSWKILHDGSMAHVWTPYEFYVNGKLSHSGVNSFSLFKTGSGWKIIYCVDTRKRP